MHAIRFARWLDARLLLTAAAVAGSHEPLDPTRSVLALAKDAGCEPGDNAGRRLRAQRSVSGQGDAYSADSEGTAACNANAS